MTPQEAHVILQEAWHALGRLQTWMEYDVWPVADTRRKVLDTIAAGLRVANEGMVEVPDA
jgi:hypothetical protein